MRFNQVFMGLVPLASLATAAPTPAPSGLCSRAGDWTDGLNILTDWEVQWPITGITRYYQLDITEVEQYTGPDGVLKLNAMLINGGYPGPVIQANWGDRIDVVVNNNLDHNGLINNNINDGVSGVTECPIPPGGSKKYSFVATQYGTSWYHSHISSQYANGIVGTIQIDGPTTYPYDTDLGTFPISDWYYDSADHIVERMMDPTNPYRVDVPGSPPPSDNILINGTNINPQGSGGEYAKVTLVPGKRHRLRLINTSADNTFSISIVGHTMTVIETDFVPVQPYQATQVFLTVGQRYDVVIEANQGVGSYWLNATLSSNGLCGASLNPYPAAIISYEGADGSLPTDVGTPVFDTYCTDDLSAQPIVTKSAPIDKFTAEANNTLDLALTVNDTISRVFWEVNNSPVNVVWEQPTLQNVADGNLTFATNENVIQLPEDNEWSFWIIQNNSPIPHPMHLHGHDFLILGRSDPVPDPRTLAGPIAFDPATDTAKLYANAPTRRDTTQLLGFGWLVLAFQAGSNPGAWVFHCHIPWHMSQGLSVKFLERADLIPGAMDLGALEPTCDQWRAYEPSNPFAKTDSGL
ncbi:multicopper oxidase-domain-containing protein [Podospora appendiculata]|uniref:laccase n=1 Tax=Podospora appendiculata TaxID=314037 RepID=A0AAE0X1F6_9PEZI|nr:multicopper oxidase-domain-containing protein [Podospora appendiculata]